MDAETELIEEVLVVERKWVAAHNPVDIDVLNHILGESYRQIQADGSVIGKEELLISYRSGKRQWDIAQGDNYEVRVIGGIAIVIGRWRGRGTNYGEIFDYSARFVAIYQKINEEWQLILDISIPLKD
jgi:hypothetical protein